MGTTASSLHVLAPAPRAIAEIESAYKKLGYVRSKTPTERTKRVIMKGGCRGGYISIYDSDNDRLDTGELKELAVILSKRLGTVSIVTSVYDSDAHSFLIYFGGKQVDSDLSGETDAESGLSALKGRKRAEKWREIFSGRDPAGSGPLSADAWQKRLDPAGDTESVFAEARLSQWCRAAGLDPGSALALCEDFKGPDTADQRTLLFDPGRRKVAKPEQPSGQQEITYFRSDDDARELLYFPAAWPGTAGKPFAIDWNLTTSGPGFSGLRVALAFEDAVATRLIGIEVVARPFFNGQLTSLKPVAQAAWRDIGEEISPDRTVFREATSFVVPPIDPETRKKFLITLRARLVLARRGHATAKLTLETADRAFPAPRLPPIRLIVPDTSWQPRVGPGSDAVLARLNQPSVETTCAILPNASERHCARVKTWFDTWLASLTMGEDVVATVRTHKHMTASGNVSKTSWSVAARTLGADKRWASLFSYERDLQTITVDLANLGDAYPIAGAVMQRSPREHRHAVAEAPDVAQAKEGLAAAVWFINDATVYKRFGTTREAQSNLVAFVAEGEVLQAWSAATTWLPHFGDYESGPGQFMTLYEHAVRELSQTLYRGPQFSSLVRDATWPSRRLRFVAPRLWLGESLAARLDLASLEGVATVRRAGLTTQIALNEDAAIGDLERALAPILPSCEDILPMLEERLAASRYGLEHVELGTALMCLAEYESGSEKLTRAVEVIKMGLTKVTSRSYPLGWAALQTPLGMVLTRLAARQTGSEALEAAAETFEEAVRGHEEANRQQPHRPLEELAAAKAQWGAVLARLAGQEDRSLAVLDDAQGDLEVTPAAEGHQVSRALIAARVASARLDIADRRSDRALAASVQGQIEAALETLRRAHYTPGIASTEAQARRARELLERLAGS
jgi:tetratricopeptide (TPR) repeat protein